MSAVYLDEIDHVFAPSRAAPAPIAKDTYFIHPVLSGVILAASLASTAALHVTPFGDTNSPLGLALVAVGCLAVLGGLTPKSSF